MIAVKGNKQITINDGDKNTYLSLGYDIAEVGEDGENLNIIENAQDKTVPYSKYQEALDKITALEAEIASIKKAAK